MTLAHVQRPRLPRLTRASMRQTPMRCRGEVDMIGKAKVAEAQPKLEHRSEATDLAVWKDHDPERRKHRSLDYGLQAERDLKPRLQTALFPFHLARRRDLYLLSLLRGGAIKSAESIVCAEPAMHCS